MKRNLKVTAVGISLIGFLALGACGNDASGNGGADEAADSMVFTSLFPEMSPIGTSLAAMGSSLAEDESGSFDVEHYWSGALVGADEQLSAVGSGMADIALTSYVYHPQDLPISNWASPLTTIAEVPTYPNPTLVGSAASTELYLENELLVQEFEEHDVYLLGVYNASNYELICAEPVESLEDARGLTVRSAGEVWAREFQALGMEPVALPPNEQYEALQRGQIDCTAYPLPDAHDFGLLEVAPHVMSVPFSPSSNQLIVNADTYDSMSEDQRTAVQEAAEVYLRTNLEQGMQAYADLFEEGGDAEELGVEIHMVPELFDAVREHQENEHANLADNAPDNVDSDEAASMVDDYRDLVGTWTTELEDAGFDFEEPETAEEVASLFSVEPDSEELADFLDELSSRQSELTERHDG